MNKKLRYRLSISKTFPAYHPRKGEATGFWDKIQENWSSHQDYYDGVPGYPPPELPKLHTIRTNYAEWERRFLKINAGEAALELYEWCGKPYQSKTKTLCQLSKDDGIGFQKLHMELTPNGWLCFDVVSSLSGVIEPDIPGNDGLSNQDFAAWFKLKPGDTIQDLAIIHFTKFRY